MKRLLLLFFLLLISACTQESEPPKRLFLGDSITDGLAFFDLAAPEQVIGNAGATAEFAYQQIEQIVYEAPDQLFIMLGQCDLMWPVANPMEYSLEHYRKLIEEIQHRLPDTKIYIQSITHIADEVQDDKLNNAAITKYNEGLSSLADQLAVHYLDLSAADLSAMFDADGIHFKKAFYDYWIGEINEKTE